MVNILKYAWIGVRNSDSLQSQFISNSITTFGNNTLGNQSFGHFSNSRRFRNIKNEYSFIKAKMDELIKNDDEVRFLLYDQSEQIYFESLSTYIIQLNTNDVISLLNSKVNSKLWLSHTVKTIPFINTTVASLKYKMLLGLFPGVYNFIVQQTYGVGGTSTYAIASELDVLELKRKLLPSTFLLVMPKIDNRISVNQHIFISDSISIFPCSEMIYNNNCNTEYSGNIFRKNPKYDADTITNISYSIAEKLSQIGYKGVAGIDYIIDHDIPYFVEINPRFQGSTYLLNMALLDQGFKSLQDMTLDLYNGSISNEPLKIGYFDGKISSLYSADYNVKKKLPDGYGCCYKNVSNGTYTYKKIEFKGKTTYI